MWSSAPPPAVYLAKTSTAATATRPPPDQCLLELKVQGGKTTIVLHDRDVLPAKDRRALEATDPAELRARQGDPWCHVLGLDRRTYGPVMFAGIELAIPGDTPAKRQALWDSWRQIGRALVMPEDRSDVTCVDAMVLLTLASSFPYVPDAKDFGIPAHLYGEGDCEDSTLLILGLAMHLARSVYTDLPWVPCAVSIELKREKAGVPGGSHVIAALRCTATDRLYPIDAANGRYPGRDNTMGRPSHERVRHLVQGDNKATSAATSVATAVHPLRPLGPDMGLDGLFERIVSVWQVDADKKTGRECHAQLEGQPPTLDWEKAWTLAKPPRSYTSEEQSAIRSGRKAWRRMVPKPMQTLALAPVAASQLAMLERLGAAATTAVLAFPGSTHVNRAQSTATIPGETWVHLPTLNSASVHLVFLPLAFSPTTTMSDSSSSNSSSDNEEERVAAHQAVYEASGTAGRIRDEFDKLEGEANIEVQKAKVKVDAAVNEVDAGVEKVGRNLDRAAAMTAEVGELALVAGRSRRTKRHASTPAPQTERSEQPFGVRSRVTFSPTSAAPTRGRGRGRGKGRGKK